MSKNKIHLTSAQGAFEREIIGALDKGLCNNNQYLLTLLNIFQNDTKNLGESFTDVYFPPNSSSLVNNVLRSNASYKTDEWKRLKADLYQNNTIFLKKFNTKKLFNFGGLVPNLELVLSVMCENPVRIKKLFISEKLNNEGSYMVNIYHRGELKPVLIDDYVPVNEENIAQVMLSSNMTQEDSKVDIWPNLIAKALAKHYINYERLIGQTIPGLMNDLSGMPTKEYKIRKLDFKQLRRCFVQNYMVISKAKKEFIKEFVNVDSKSLVTFHCHLVHAIDLSGTGDENSFFMQMKNITHDFNKQTTFNTAQKLAAIADWKKHKKTAKDNCDTFWVTWAEFQEFFSAVYVTHYEAGYTQQQKKFLLKDNQIFALDLQVNSNKSLVYIENDQLDKLYSEKSYNYSDVRMYVIRREHDTEENHTSSTLVRAAMFNNTRTNFVEVLLTKGRYTVICECEKTQYMKDYTLSLYHEPTSLIEIEKKDNFVIKRAYNDIICSMAI